MTAGQPLSVKRSSALALRSGSERTQHRLRGITVAVRCRGGTRRKRVYGGKSMCLIQGASPQRTEKVRSKTRKAAANFSLKHLTFFGTLSLRNWKKKTLQCAYNNRVRYNMYIGMHRSSARGGKSALSHCGAKYTFGRKERKKNTFPPRSEHRF